MNYDLYMLASLIDTIGVNITINNIETVILKIGHGIFNDNRLHHDSVL